MLADGQRGSKLNSVGQWKFSKSGLAGKQIKKEADRFSEAGRFIQFAQTWLPYGERRTKTYS